MDIKNSKHSLTGVCVGSVASNLNTHQQSTLSLSTAARFVRLDQIIRTHSSNQHWNQGEKSRFETQCRAKGGLGVRRCMFRRCWCERRSVYYASRRALPTTCFHWPHRACSRLVRSQTIHQLPVRHNYSTTPSCASWPFRPHAPTQCCSRFINHV